MRKVNVQVDKNSINRFYHSLKFTRFNTLTKERAFEIDEYVNNWHTLFYNNSYGFLTLMTFTSLELLLRPNKYHLLNDDEKAYFYIKMVDPDLLFLEAYECANTIDERLELLKKNFGFYDSALIYLEKNLNNHFKLYTNIWDRNLIKK